MPFRRRNFRRGKKKSFKKRSFKKKRRSPNVKGLARSRVIIYHDPHPTPSILPNAYYGTMTYRRQFNYPLTTALDNKIYTPTVLDKVVDLTSSKVHEFDEMNALYKRYVVMAFDWDITINNQSVDPVEYFIFPWTQAQDPGSNSDAMTRAGVHVYMAQNSSSTHAIIHDKGHCSIKKLFGIPKVASEEEFWGSGSTSPTIVPRFYMTVSNVLGNASTSYVVDIYFKMYVKWFDRNSIAVTDDGEMRHFPSTVPLVDHRESLGLPARVIRSAAKIGCQRKIRPTRVVENDYEMQCI